MARPVKKTIYERITEQNEKISAKETELNDLKCELQALYNERDNEEMQRLFRQAKDSGLNIDEALSKLMQ